MAGLISIELDSSGSICRTYKPLRKPVFCPKIWNKLSPNVKATAIPVSFTHGLKK